MNAPRLRMCALALAVAALGATAAQSHTTSSAPAVKIGVLSDCTGYDGYFGDFSFAGVDLALIQAGAKSAGASPRDGVTGASVAGRPLQIAIGCGDGSPASALREARRLVEVVGVRILIGPLGGDEEFALQEYARRRPGIAFVNGSASLQLQHPTANFFSFHADGAQWSAGLGSYAFSKLGWRRVVTVTDAHSAFNWAQTAGFDAEFCSLGGTIAKRVSIPSGTKDYSATVAAVPRSGVDGIFVASAGSAADALIAARPRLREHLATKLLTGVPNLDAAALPRGTQLAGFVVADRLNQTGRAGRAYAASLRAHFPHLNMEFETVFDQDYYVAMRATLQALRAARGDLSRNEHVFLSALARAHFDGPYGPVRLDRAHQAVVTIYLRQFTASHPANTRLLRKLAGVDRRFGGYFGRHDPPPTESSPACTRRNPPPWVIRP